MRLHSLLIGSSSAVALCLGTAAHAQDNDRESAVERVLNPVTVTATKKADVEDVQDVPIAVTAYNADTLDALNVQTLEDLSFSTPNVALDDIGTARGTANFAIRGLGVNSSIPSIDPAVGVFIDGVYLGVNNGVVVDLFDLESVEVLRGPQGLLFGRNTTGGAVVVNTANPTDELSYKLRAATDGPIDSDRGGLNTTIQGIVSGPLIEGKLNGKIGVYYNDDAGYFKNQFDDSNHGEAQTYVYRGALEFFATEDITFLGKVEYSDSRVDGPSGQNRGFFDRDGFDISLNNPGFNENESLLASLRTDIDVDFGDGTITNILGYRSYDSVGSADIDAQPFTGFHSDTELEQEQISNELRYAGTFGKAEVTTGVYYFDQSVAYTEIRNLPPLTPLINYGGGDQDHTVFGVFGQVDYAFTENFIGIFGLRYSNEEKDAGITYIRPRSECSVVGGTCPTEGINGLLAAATGGLVQEPNGFTDSDEWSNWTPKLGFQYFFSPNQQLYGNYTKGFRSGGYNFRITDAAAFLGVVAETGQFAFDEEEVDSFELGHKYQSEDGRVQLNAAVFYTEVEDMQREVNASSETAAVVQTILNTADAQIFGFEVDGRLAVTDNLLLTANLGFIDAEYTDIAFDISGDNVVNGDDLRLKIPRVPETTYGFGLLHDANLGSYGSLVSRVNYQHRDETAYTDSNFGWVQAADMVSADFTWNTSYDGLAISLYGDNLLDEVQAGNDTQQPFGGPRSTGINRPFADNPAAGTFSPLKKGRTVGIEVTFVR